jgi:hypothetical protein
MHTTKIERTISTPTGRIDVALFEITNARAVTWYEVKVRDHRKFPHTETGMWLTIRTYAVEDAARAGYEEWFALEKKWAAPVSEYLIQVYDNDDNDTGIWHQGSNLVDLVDRAAASVAVVYDTEVTKVTQGISGGFVDREGRTYRYQAHLI